MEESQVTEFEPENIESLPEDVRDTVNDLIWLGYVEDIFEFCGHRFGLRTLYGEEELLAGLVTKEYAETIGATKAYAWGLVGLALTAVNDDTEFCPQVTADKRAYARARFQYCTSNWMWPVGNFLYSSYLSLLEQQKGAVEAMEDLSRGSLLTPTPFAGSSIDREDSEEPKQTAMDFLDSEPEDSTPSDSDSSNT